MITDPIIMVRDDVKYAVRPPTWAVLEMDVLTTSRKFFLRSITICEREAITEIYEALTLFATKSTSFWRTFPARVIASTFNYVDVPEYQDNGPAWGLSQIPFRVTTAMVIRGLRSGSRIRITPTASEVPNAVREQYRNR